MIEGTKHDKRVKLTNDQKSLVKTIRETQGLSYQKIANLFEVSKRLIIFICKPETLEESKKRREERGGWKHHYDKEKHRISTAKYREHLKEIKNDKNTSE